MMSILLDRELDGSLHLSAMEKMFSSNINEDNCMRMYILADSMQSVQLKKDAFEVIKGKWDAVVKNEDFRECIMNYPELVFEITKAIYLKVNDEQHHHRLELIKLLHTSFHS